MRIADFKDLVDFPEPLQGVVYVLFWSILGGKDEPFYVGQTGRFLSARMAEYLFADFQASTDFKVGEAIRYLTAVKGVRVRVGQIQSTDRFTDESKLIAELRSPSRLLLNGFTGYNYKTADRQKELVRIHEFCDRLVSSVSE